MKIIILKKLFLGISFLLFLNTEGLAEEEYVLTSKVHEEIKLSTSTFRADGAQENLSASLYGKESCVRLKASQFENLEMTKIIWRYEVSTREFKVGQYQICAPQATTQQYPISTCGAPGNYDLVEISENSGIRVDLTSEEPLVDPNTIIEGSTSKAVTCLDPSLETTHCDSHMVFIKCFNKNEELNNITCFMPDKHPTSRCKTLKISRISLD